MTSSSCTASSAVIPTPDELVGAAAARTQRVLVLTLPQQRRWIGWGLAAVNVWLRSATLRVPHVSAFICGDVEAAANAGGLTLDGAEAARPRLGVRGVRALAQDARMPERVAPRLRPDAEPMRARADGDLREQTRRSAC